MRSVAITVFAISVLYSGCKPQFGSNYHLDEATFDDKALQMVQQRSGLQLPTGAQGLNLFYDGSGKDDGLAARIYIPEAAIPELREQIKQIYGTNASVAGAGYGDQLPWWNEDRMQVDIERELSVSRDGLHLILGIEDGRWILLLQWLST